MTWRDRYQMLWGGVFGCAGYSLNRDNWLVVLFVFLFASTAKLVFDEIFFPDTEPRP